ncbi:MAG: hypothetical protein HYU41_28450 [Candidatus Rokubacteria bacterium]|nr:hypothetical protein [Candidatus Rokubacteria bacterium]
MNRLYWPSWALATATTGLVGGFFLGHSLLLGRFFDWLLTSGRARTLAETYPAFREGSATLDIFYALAGLQVLAGVAFAVASLVGRRSTIPGLLVGLASISWPTVHYLSGFAALEAAVLRSPTEPPRHVVDAFVAYNTPVHIYHAAILIVALCVLLAVPRTSVTAKDLTDR